MHDGGSVPQGPAPLPAGFMADDDEALKRPPELVYDVLPRNGTGALIGQSGSGKTVIAAHAAICISSGQPFFGHEIVERVGCVHLAYENGGNIKHRVRAARLHAGLDTKIPFLYAARAGNLLDPAHFDATARGLKACNRYFRSRFDLRLGLVTIDTLSAAFITKDENDNSEIIGISKVLIGLSREIDAFVLGVHHMGKDPKAGARGASARRDNVDFQMLCLAERNVLTGECKDHRLIVDKNRDGPEGPLGGFDLERVEIGRDDSSKPFYALAAKFSGAASVTASNKAAPKSVIAFRQAFEEARHLRGRQHSVLQGGGVKSSIVVAVPVEAVRAEFYRRWATGDEDEAKAREARQKAFKRTLNTASGFGREVLRSGEEVLWSL